ncbi:hypothetical protein, partial [Corynebacterium sp. ES2775-CONJ]|uniref:hypothetical protein n=1 Tax=Corynebacterium sp. ES2775-CONJ TaxID=2974029 RepID=UPI00216939A5
MAMITFNPTTTQQVTNILESIIARNESFSKRLLEHPLADRLGGFSTINALNQLAQEYSEISAHRDGGAARTLQEILAQIQWSNENFTTGCQKILFTDEDLAQSLATAIGTSAPALYPTINHTFSTLPEAIANVPYPQRPDRNYQDFTYTEPTAAREASLSSLLSGLNATKTHDANALPDMWRGYSKACQRTALGLMRIASLIESENQGEFFDAAVHTITELAETSRTIANNSETMASAAEKVGAIAPRITPEVDAAITAIEQLRKRGAEQAAAARAADDPTTARMIETETEQHAQRMEENYLDQFQQRLQSEIAAANPPIRNLTNSPTTSARFDTPTGSETISNASMATAGGDNPHATDHHTLG